MGEGLRFPPQLLPGGPDVEARELVVWGDRQ